MKEKIDIENTDSEVEEVDKPRFGKRTRKEALIDAAIWLALTAYIIAIIACGSSAKAGFGLACVVYVFISLRLLARHMSMSKVIYEPVGRAMSSGSVLTSKFPKRFITPLLFSLTFVGLLVGAICFPGSRLQSIAGIVVLLTSMVIFSKDRKAIPWYTVASGLFIQFVIAMVVLKTKPGQDIFGYISKFIGDFLALALVGLKFIFGASVNTNNFAASVLPAIVFFCAFIAIVYHFGGMQYIVAKLAWLFVRLMDTSGAESVVACASPFVGQGESALLVGPFIQYMTRSEIHSTMVSGFATIAGSVLLFYLQLVNDPKTILCCCVMSIPAGLLLSKMRLPEKEVSISKGAISIPPSDDKPANFLHAATNGSATGMHLIILIAGSLLAIVSLFAAADLIVGWAFQMVNIVDWVHGPDPTATPPVTQPLVTIELLLSYVFAPVAWFIGVPFGEARQAGELMATKMVVNEFVAYLNLNAMKHVLSPRTQDLMAFALCGFANLASIGNLWFNM